VFVVRFNFKQRRECASAFPRRDAPEFLQKPFRLSENRGRRECRAPNAPAASRANKIKHTSVVTTVTPEITRHSPRNGFTAYFALSPAIGLVCHRRLARLLARLDAGVEASEPHDFAVRVSALVFSAARVHRIPPRVRDDRDTPLMWDETPRIMDLIWVRREGKYFCKWGWTGHFGKHEVICPTG
jgi:hypothetical protein